MARSPAPHFLHFAFTLLFLATLSVSHPLCDSDVQECEAVEEAEASTLKAASLLQVQSHSASWPKRKNSKHAQGPTSLPRLRHPGSILEFEGPSGGAHRPTGLPTMHHQEASEMSSQKSSVTAPCQCEVDNAEWAQPAPRPPRCIFIDLGAADGNTFEYFLKNGYGEVHNCPSGGEYEAILVEANPRFEKPLLNLQANSSGRVRSLVSSAAYMCEGFTSFYLDTVDVEQNFWGSSMSPNANDVKRSGGKKHVRVPLVNVARLIMESALPEDYVLLKVDIEGSEHDIIPCLTQSRAAFLIDALYVEKHPVEWSLAGSPQGALQSALAILQERGIDVPEYNTAW